MKSVKGAKTAKNINTERRMCDKNMTEMWRIDRECSGPFFTKTKAV